MHEQDNLFKGHFSVSSSRSRIFSAPQGSENEKDLSSPLSSSDEALSTSLSDEAVTAKGTSKDGPFLPSYRQLIVFTATTILIWISEPLLSLVDTTIVGMTSSSRSAVVQIAALGPATTLYDSSIYMTYFLAIATTNLISPALAKKDWKKLRKSTSHFMGLAVIFGSIVAAVCLTGGKQLITSMVGTTQSQQVIIPLATQYARIRAAVAPFAVVDFCAQSFCLACLDTKTPAIAVAVASLVNIVGDSILCPLYGIQGAAVATAMATVSSCAILVRQVRRKTKEWKTLQEEEEYIAAALKSKTLSINVTAASTSIQTKVVNGAIEFIDSPDDIDLQDNNNTEKDLKASSRNNVTRKSTNGAINGAASTNIPFCSLPDRKSLVDLVGLAGPIFLVMMGKIACYSVMTIQATRLGIIPLAAHNIMMRVFFFFACFGDSLSQAAQTFFPQTPLKTKLLKRLLFLSTGVGLIISQASQFILTNLGVYLTKDAAILQTMATYAPYMACSMLLHPFIMLAEGAILARRDLMYLVGMYVSTMALHFGMVLRWTSTFSGLWLVFLGFQSIRLLQFASRVIWKTRREDSQVATAPVTS